MQILFLVHRLPYPPDKGERIRAFQELRYLCQRHQVDLFCFSDSKEAARQQKFLAPMCRHMYVEVLSHPSRLLHAAHSFINGQPFSFGFFHSPLFQNKVYQALRRHSYDLAFVYSSSMGQYIPRPSPVPVVVDFVDADSHKFQQYAASSRGVRAWFYRREAARVAREERSLGRLASLSLAVTEHDARELQQSIADDVRVEVVPNGVLVPEDRAGQPPTLVELRPFLLFVGTMSYWPNEDAVLYFAHCILPLIHKNHPEIKFVVVGRDPGRRVRALASKPGIVVTGSVPDPFPYFRNAEASVAPFRISQGFHNKIAESLAVGTPVVASSRARAGIGLSEHEGIFVGDTPEEFSARIDSILNPELRQSLWRNASAVRQMLSWDSRLGRMERFIAQTVKDPKSTASLWRAIKVMNPVSNPSFSRPQPGCGLGATPIAQQPANLAAIRVMHVLDRLDTGGTEKAVLKLIRGLDEDLFEHYICTLRGTDPSAGQWSAGVQLVNLGREGTNFKFNVPRLVRAMRAIQPAVVHSRNWGAIEAVIAARIAGVPAVVHSEHGYELEMQSGLPLRRRVLRHLTYRMASATATVTHELRNYHAGQAWWRPERIRILYNGVDLDEFRSRLQAREALRQQLGIPAQALVLGSVGRMVRLKDFMTLLKAARLLFTEIPGLYVVLVGAGPELSNLQEFVASAHELEGRIIFLGMLDQVADALNAMDIFVLPSMMEGMSNTLLEAMAVGLPIVATRVGGNMEVVGEGVCGYLFTPQDVHGLAGLLRTLLRDGSLRADFGVAARQRAAKEFSLQAMVARYRDLYLELALCKPALAGRQIYVRD